MLCRCTCIGKSEVWHQILYVLLITTFQFTQYSHSIDLGVTITILAVVVYVRLQAMTWLFLPQGRRTTVPQLCMQHSASVAARTFTIIGLFVLLSPNEVLPFRLSILPPARLRVSGYHH